MSESKVISWPASWEVVNFSSVVENISTNGKKLNQKQYLTDGEFPVIDQGKEGVGGRTDRRELLVEAKFPVVVFGDHTRVVKFVKHPFVPGADGVKVLQPNGYIKPLLLKYIAEYLSISIKDKGYARHYQWVAKELIGIPPEKEQHRIVAKIEELFSELDKGIESLKAAREQLKVYRQSLLKHAFEGKLTEQWRKDNADKLEIADELLARIQREREARYQKQLEDWKKAVKEWEGLGCNGNRPSKPREFQVPSKLIPAEIYERKTLPEIWGWSKIGFLFDVFVGSTPSRKNQSFWNGDIPWVSSGEVSFCDICDTKEKITALGYENASTELHPVGTVMLAMIGEGKTRGQAAILKVPAAHNQNTAAIRVSETNCSSKLLYYYLLFQYESTRKLGSGNNQKALNKSRVSEMLTPIIPALEQNEIVVVLDSQLSIIEKQVSDINEYINKSESLRQAILKKAFSGQLVPQDPNDEPASELLKRIAEEKSPNGSDRKSRHSNA
jgi:type I restriction enzyme S subunit